MQTVQPTGDAGPIGVENLPQHPRKWWAATLLHLLTPGLGQVYNGQAKKGMLFLAFVWISIIVLILLMIGLSVIAPANVILSFFLFVSFYIYILKDAVSTARKLGGTYQRKSYNKWYLYLGIMIITAFVVDPVFKHTITEAYRIPSGGMEPTLLVGDYLYANKIIYRFKNLSNGDIIVFKYPGDGKTNYVKRLIAVSGQTVEIVNKKVFVDGKEILFPTLAGEADSGPVLPHYPEGAYAPFSYSPYDYNSAYNRDNFGPYKVPSDSFFVMGDNQDNSFDSRFWGPVPQKLIIGKTEMKYWSWDNVSHRVRWERIGKTVQ